MPLTLENLTEPDSGPRNRILNVAAYKFTKLDKLEESRSLLKDKCGELGLRGTILLSPEGINLFLAGEPANVRECLRCLREMPELADLEAKESFSEKVPFRRMLVRLKKEIIPCGMEQIRPGQETSPKLTARELKSWLDQDRPLRLLDVRNKYEVEMGTFQGAEQLGLGHFRDFAAALEQLPETAKEEPLVMFCTGGIRCEKAGPIMERAGFRQVYQLDGGILKYFEECGGEYWDGSCFVFDGRVALDSELKPTGNLLCFACQAVLTAEDVTSGKFMFGEYCPHCHVPPEQKKHRLFEDRQRTIRDIAASQPGSQPYTNHRDIHVAGKFDGMKMIDFLCAWQPAISASQWQGWMEQGEIRDRDGMACNADQTVRAGNSFVHVMPNTTEPEINPDIRLLHEDDSLVVVDKPAPLPGHPSGRFNRNTLQHILGQAFPHEKLRLAHRLDAATTGVVLLARKYRAARAVQQQFASQTVAKVYLARVHGHPKWNEIEIDHPISVAPVAAGGERAIDAQGQAARTECRVVKRFADRTSLLAVKPLTGRTNQIRLHLQHIGHSIVGDNLYPHVGKQSPAEHRQSEIAQLAESSGPLCLHASSLSLVHPETGEQVSFKAPDPAWISIEKLKTENLPASYNTSPQS